MALLGPEAVLAELPIAGTVLNRWLERSMRQSSGDPDRVRAKAALSEFAAADEVPAGAKSITKAVLKRLVATCDVELLVLCMCWANRLA
jgi:hypothetical protein